MAVTILIYSVFVTFVANVVPAEASNPTAYFLGIMIGLYMSTKELS